MKKLGRKLIESWLGFLSRRVLKRNNPLVIAVAGNSAKSYIKTGIAKALSEQGYDVQVYPRSYNTEIGLPLAILQQPGGGSSSLQWLLSLIRCTLSLNKKLARILVVELGIRDPGDARKILNISMPDILLITNLEAGQPNMEETIKGQAKEISEAIKEVSQNGLVILNQDDLWLKLAEKDAQKGNLLTISLEEEADYYLDKDQLHTPKNVFKLKDGLRGTTAKIEALFSVATIEAINKRYKDQI